MNGKVRKAIYLLTVPILVSIGCEGCIRNSAATSNIENNKFIESDFELQSFNDLSEQVLAFKQNYRKNMLNFAADTSAQISKYGMKFVIQGQSLEGRSINFSNNKLYSDLPGVTAFRGNNMRDGGSYGTADIKEGKLELLWKKKIGAIDNWTGVGWNGQPSIVQWSREMIDSMNIKQEKKSKENLKEVIYATLDGNVYFIDLEDGKDTRDKLNIGAPIKGSLTVDPRGIPLLYVGQGINKNGNRYVDFAYRMFSLTDFKKLYEIRGNDSFAKRDWGAFDSTALIDKNTDSIFLCGENGLFYSGKLNTKYENGKVQISPELTKYRYDVPGMNKKGIENSIAIYKNYGYFADNDGLLQCVDINTLTPVWALNVGDDTDGTVVLEEKTGTLSLYTATEVDHQGNNGFSYARKIDATSGKILWENKYRCSYNEGVNGGALATPLVGKNDISNLVIFNIARHPQYNEGLLVAIDKESGKEIWRLKLNNYCWSSPVALYNKEGKSYIVQCDSTGKAMLIEGVSGKLLHSIELGANVEGTPAAFNDTLVVGTRGAEILGFKVK
ncbi:PQQ-binding-like beta-propeller repeat protein [Clostridium swellfunianum]|uniref:outer membrane protein assembly factor BamB family protein n=1 Tax=Clostridium swellfunianum TaxID=1367462 RepID=UPI00202F5B3E|nr:PQQ-binding-like beta-propeller repeat protein [Clostridium swellfunianum]MCM0649453.1 PQQ-binding-like beta-propeller repeat protein [Clostridium swellfunianum]